jgi:hypothetical protein
MPNIFELATVYCHVPIYHCYLERCPEVDEGVLFLNKIRLLGCTEEIFSKRLKAI